ncbi:MAG: hypothetical protein ACW992_01135, partial [Candidatus Thorarchaeota archaeon]
FFAGQPIMENTREGVFDKRLAEEWIDVGNLMAERTGHPLMIQAFGRTPKAMEMHLSWLAEHFEGPIIFESVKPESRIRGIEFCDETGLGNRALYNSINLSMTDEEKNALTGSSLDKAIVLGWTPRATSLPGRMATITEMVASAQDMGISKFLIDPGALPVGNGHGLEYRTLLAVKSQLGFPTSLAPHNAPSAWKFIKESDLDDERMHLTTLVAASSVAQVFAADCIMYGSMIRTREAFGAAALIGNAISSAAAESGHAIGLERELFDPPTSG